MKPETRAAIEGLSEPLRSRVEAVVAEGEHELAQAQFEDMGYEDCPICRRARLRGEFAGSARGAEPR